MPIIGAIHLKQPQIGAFPMIGAGGGEREKRIKQSRAE